MSVGIHLEKREGWRIAKVLKSEDDLPEVELKPLLRFFQSQTDINTILILQAHLMCVKGRYLENQMLRRTIVREGEQLPFLPKESWIAWEVSKK